MLFVASVAKGDLRSVQIIIKECSKRKVQTCFFSLIFIRQKIINYMMSMEDETVGDKPTETVEELIQKVGKVAFKDK